MKIEITTVSLSKKGTIWIQAKLLEGETPRTMTVFKCEEQESTEVKQPKTKKVKDESDN